MDNWPLVYFVFQHQLLKKTGQSWRELPQVSFLSRQKYACRDKTFRATNTCLSQQICVSTNILSRQNIFCRDKHNFVSTKVLSRQAYFCCDKRRLLSRQTRVCRDKTFVAAKMILVAAHASDSWQALAEFEFVYKLLSLKYH